MAEMPAATATRAKAGGRRRLERGDRNLQTALWSPTIRAAIVADLPWLDLFARPPSESRR